MRRSWIILGIIIIVVIPGLGYGIYNLYASNGGLSLPDFISTLAGKVNFGAATTTSYKTPEEKDQFVRFDMEVFDKIQSNFWKKSPEADLADLFHLAVAKAASTTPESITLPARDRTGVAKMLSDVFGKIGDEAKKKIALDTAIITLYNLPPAGRNGLLSTKEETAFRENVSNIDRSKDLYQDLGVEKGATPEQVEKAYEEKRTELASQNTPEAKQELAKADYAHEVLTKSEAKALYDQNQIEPTVFPHIIGGKTLYLYIDKISPTTLQEFGVAIVGASTTPGLNSLILDLRSNIGGSLDFAQYFLGVFLGQNQYAFDLFHQGDYQVQRTVLAKANELDRYEETAILTDNMTQSTAELITAAFKRFKLAHVVGTKTKGWGTVENTFPIDTRIDPAEKYSVLLVHSLTLRDDNQPIEERGVDPDIYTDKKNWQDELSKYFRMPDLISAIKKTAGQAPMK